MFFFPEQRCTFMQRPWRARPGIYFGVVLFQCAGMMRVKGDERTVWATERSSHPMAVRRREVAILLLGDEDWSRLEAEEDD